MMDDREYHLCEDCTEIEEEPIYLVYIGDVDVDGDLMELWECQMCGTDWYM